MKNIDQELSNKLSTKLNVQNDDLPMYYDIEQDLQFLYRDKRRFTRSEAMPVVVWKILSFRNHELVDGFLRSLITDQAERFNFIDPDRPEETLLEFFTDLKSLFLKVSVSESPTVKQMQWKKLMNEVLISIHNSLFRVVNGHYYLTNGDKADGLVNEYLQLIKKEEPVKQPEVQKPVVNDKLLKITEVADILNCSRQTVYDVHLKNGLKSVKPTGEKGYQKVWRSDLYKYKEQLN